MVNKRNVKDNEQSYLIKNMAEEYPELNNKQLLSLIRVSQILITDLEERVAKLENEIKL